MERYLSAGESAIEHASSLDATDAEVFIESGAGLTVKVFDGRVEQFSFSETAGLGVRVFKGSRMGRSYTSDLSKQSVEGTVAKALESALISPEDEHRGLPSSELIPPGGAEGGRLGEDLGIWSDDVSAVPAGEKIELALEMERLARKFDKRIRGVDISIYSDSYGDVFIINSRGLSAGFRASVCYGYVVPMAGEGGESQTGFGFTAGRSFASLDAGEAAREGSSKAVEMLGGKQVESARLPVLFDNLTCGEIVAMLGSALSAESVVKGKSFLAGKLGQGVAAGIVELVDDGLMPGGYGTSPFDGEGVATSRKALIGGGTLLTYLQDCYTASRMETRTTGNASRDSYRAPVGVSPTNLSLEAGSASRDELRSGMERGIEVVELQGTHAGMNVVTGEISLGAKGFLVERGRRVHPVREVTIAGDLEDLLKGVAALGSDVRYTPLLGGIGAPSMLVEGLVVGGR